VIFPRLSAPGVTKIDDQGYFGLFRNSQRGQVGRVGRSAGKNDLGVVLEGKLCTLDRGLFGPSVVFVGGFLDQANDGSKRIFDTRHNATRGRFS